MLGKYRVILIVVTVLITVAWATMAILDAIESAWVASAHSAAKSLAAGICETNSNELVELFDLVNVKPDTVLCLDDSDYDLLIRFLEQKHQADLDYSKPGYEKGDFRDPWGRRYQVSLQMSDPHKAPYAQVVFAGPDQQFGTDDDIVEGDIMRGFPVIPDATTQD